MSLTELETSIKDLEETRTVFIYFSLDTDQYMTLKSCVCSTERPLATSHERQVHRKSFIMHSEQDDDMIQDQGFVRAISNCQQMNPLTYKRLMALGCCYKSPITTRYALSNLCILNGVLVEQTSPNKQRNTEDIVRRRPTWPL